MLIDFSEYSENLIDFAFNFSEIIGAKVVFVHRIFGMVPRMADPETKAEMVKSEIEEAQINLRKLARGRIYGDDSFYVSQKPVLTILNELANEYYFDWVFAGLKSTGILKRLFIGSTTISIIDESNLLSVAVPIRNPISVPKKLMIGINSKYPINKDQLSWLLSSLNPQIKEIEFFTILKDDENETRASDYLSRFQTEYEAHQPTIRLYKGENGFDLLKERVELTRKSFLVLQQGSRSLTDQLFRKFMINELVYSAKTPLIVLSS